MNPEVAASRNAEVLRQKFAVEAQEKALKDTKLTAKVACVAYPLFLVVDYFLYPGIFSTLLFIRLSFVGFSLVILLLTATRLGEKNAFLLGMLEYLFGGLTIVLMVHLAGGYTSEYYAGINLVLLGFIFILPLNAIRTAIVCVLLYAAYIIPILLLQRIERWDVFLNNNFFLVATILLVILSAHLATRMRYKEFSHRYELDRLNKELQQADVLKSQFFANVSHEVRTPLTSILAPIQSLHQGDVGELSEEQHGLVAQMYRNGLKLLDMINQMLDFSKYEARKMQLRLRQLDLHELAEDAVAIFREVTERKGIRLYCIRDSEVGLLYLDAEKIERILTNLVRNAIKFTEKGSITVRVGRNGGRAYLEVRDTGIGIPREHLPHIFKRFQQVDASSTRKFEGTGLGLTIVKEAVELMHGAVSVESEEGRGTSFRVELPTNLQYLARDAFIDRRRRQRRTEEQTYNGEERRQAVRREDDQARVSVDDLALVERQLADIEDASEAAELPLAPAADHVLLVEDNADLRRYVGKMLRRYGHRVTTAHDGLEGWEAAQRDPPDVIVSDVMMPRMDGYELIRKIASNPETSAIPIVLITAKPELESKLEGLKVGAIDYLSKPINMRELDARVRNLITLRKLQATVAREQEQRKRIQDLTMAFSVSLDMRDSLTANHCRDILKYGTMIAEELGMSTDQAFDDSLLLHDIGKIRIPDSILKKPAPLNEEEWEIMKKHPEWGYEALTASYPEVANVILAHQEHFDGTGYPRGLKGEEIPPAARIIAVADAYHAMTSDRPYRKALSAEQAVEELLRHRGSQFDPLIVDGFVRGLVTKGIIVSPDRAHLQPHLRAAADFG
jgi:response regulator RpfG family c-di-GMP phosphodiesterase/signal transduction histidine kinase